MEPLEGDTAAGAALERGSSCLKGMSILSEAHSDVSHKFSIGRIHKPISIDPTHNKGT